MPVSLAKRVKAGAVPTAAEYISPSSQARTKNLFPLMCKEVVLIPVSPDAIRSVPKVMRVPSLVKGRIISRALPIACGCSIKKYPVVSEVITKFLT